MPCSRPSQSIIRRTASRGRRADPARRRRSRSAARPAVVTSAVRNSGAVTWRSFRTGQPDERLASASRCGPADLAVALARGRRPSTAGRRRGTPAGRASRPRQLAACPCCRRRRPAGSSSGGHRWRATADLAAERHDRDADAGQELRPAHRSRARGVIRRSGSGKLVRRGARSPGCAPTSPSRRARSSRRSIWQRVARLGGRNRDRAVDLVDLVEVEPGRRRRPSRSPSAGRRTSRAGRTRRRRRWRPSRSRDRRVPRQVEPIARDVDRGLVASTASSAEIVGRQPMRLVERPTPQVPNGQLTEFVRAPRPCTHATAFVAHGRRWQGADEERSERTSTCVSEHRRRQRSPASFRRDSRKC
jgi:hypothetical protein